MKIQLSLAFLTASSLLFSSCSSTHNNQTREVASKVDNLAVLRSIPLVQGIENRKANEEAVQNELIEIFKSFADRNRNQNGSLNRGTHAKGSCFNGNFTISSEEELKSFYGYSPTLSQRLKQGLFSHNGVFPVTMRFANADGLGRKQADGISDVRGFSFSVTTPNSITDFTGNHRQDFMMNSTAAFVSGNIEDFAEVAKAGNVVVYKDLSHLPNVTKLPKLLESLKTFKEGDTSSGVIQSYSVLDYWTNLPYTHGKSDIAKYKVTPCKDLANSVYESAEGLDANYLQDQIRTEAKDGSICYLFQVQFYDQKKLQSIAVKKEQKKWTTTDWVENGGLLWDEKALPFYTVAKIEVPEGSSSVSCDDKHINTRLHATKENLPIGSIARVRTFIEEVSRSRRQAAK